MFWTVRQEEVMRENCFRGARAVQEALLRECGVRRTVRAIEAHASCGVVGVRLNRQSGMCARCTDLMHVEEERAFNELLQAEAEGCADSAEIERLEREYAALRQRNSRLCRKHGLRSKAKRDC